MGNHENIQIGMTLTLQKKITLNDTSLNYGSGKIENLFATTSLVAFMIEASSQLVDPKLEEGYVSIGHHVEVDHFKPTVLGSTVTIEVKIVQIEGEKFTLAMRAYDEFGQIGFGKHTRSIVSLNKLMEKAQQREFETQEEA